MSKPWLRHLCHNRGLHWPLQYLVGVPPRSLMRHRETFVGLPIAKAQSRQPLQARFVQHSRRAPCLPAKVQPVQRRSAACFKVRLIPHSAKTEDLPAKSKPRLPQARHVDTWEPGFQNRPPSFAFSSRSPQGHPLDPPGNSTLSRNHPNRILEEPSLTAGVAISRPRTWPLDPSRDRPAGDTRPRLCKQPRGQARWQGLGTAPAPPATTSQPACW
jgi:hypothetical protein